ncbi:SecC motif-containing protein, partial [Vibrio alfacsensis]
HYTRVLAEIAGIIYRRSGRWHVKKAAQKKYLSNGVHIFFKPMLEAATAQYNWGYLDGFKQHPDLQCFWLYMLWRLQNHGSVDILVQEMLLTFPDLLLDLIPDDYNSIQEQLSRLIEIRF